MNSQLYSEILSKNLFRLMKVLDKMREIKIEIPRVCEVTSTLLDLGMDRDALVDSFKKEVLNFKNSEGEWPGISDTIFCLQFLSFFPELKDQINNSISKLFSRTNSDGGYGRFIGDRSRIPICWRLLESLFFNNVNYNENIKKIIKWIEKEWTKDMELSGLSYKCAGVLIANKYYPYFNQEFIDKSVEWLVNDQNEEGGWSARKDASAGSISSYTTLALRALLGYQDKSKVQEAIQKGIKWVEEKYKSSELWKEHPVEKAIMQVLIFLNIYLKNETKFR